MLDMASILSFTTLDIREEKSAFLLLDVDTVSIFAVGGYKIWCVNNLEYVSDEDFPWEYSLGSSIIGHMEVISFK